MSPEEVSQAIVDKAAGGTFGQCKGCGLKKTCLDGWCASCQGNHAFDEERGVK